MASAQDLPFARYDSLTADEIVGRLGELSQVDLTKVQSYERRNQSRVTVIDRIDSLRGDEPWTGYDEQTADEVVSALSGADDERVTAVRAYERAHKARKTVLEATERELANA